MQAVYRRISVNRERSLHGRNEASQRNAAAAPHANREATSGIQLPTAAAPRGGLHSNNSAEEERQAAPTDRHSDVEEDEEREAGSHRVVYQGAFYGTLINRDGTLEGFICIPNSSSPKTTRRRRRIGFRLTT